MKGFILLMCTLLCSCGTGNQCIKIGGTYDNAGGEIEYCWDRGKAKESGVPALVDSAGKSYFGLDEEQIKAILERLHAQAKEVGTLSAPASPVSPVVELLKLLGEKKSVPR